MRVKIGPMTKPYIDWSGCPGIEIDPNRQSGSPVFAGTRVPVSVVLNNLHHGGTPDEIDEIVDNFPVTREQVWVVLGYLEKHSVPSLSS